MEFCTVCENMMYIRLLQPEDGGSGEESAAAKGGLNYYCKNCGFNKAADAVDVDGGARISSTNYADNNRAYKQYATPHIVHDPTLPRVNNIACPNKGCTKPAGANDEVIFVKYDRTMLLYMYYCTHCNMFWKSGGAERGQDAAALGGLERAEQAE